MMPTGITALRRSDLWLIGAASAVMIYVYAGFYFPDSYLLSYGAIPARILWFIRIALPAAYAGLVALYVNLRRQKIEPGALALLTAAASLSLYIAYGVGDLFYQRWFDSHREEYHPYLQLMPPEHRAAWTSNSVKIFCVGGSTTELPDSSGHDWPSRVEGILRTTYGMKQVEVSNFGRQWYTSFHSLINYEANLRPQKPNVILFMESVNDLLQNADFSYFSHGVFREDYGHFYGPVNRIIDRRSLWRYLRDVVSGLWYAKSRRVINTDTFPGLAAYRRNINTIIELAGHDSARVVLMTEPYLNKRVMSPEELSAVGMLRAEAINDSLVWSSETMLNGLEQYNDALRSLVDHDHVLLIDLEKEVPKSLTYFRDEVHYRDTTYGIIASFVAKKLHEYLANNGNSRDTVDHRP